MIALASQVRDDPLPERLARAAIGLGRRRRDQPWARKRWLASTLSIDRWCATAGARRSPSVGKAGIGPAAAPSVAVGDFPAFPAGPL